MKVVYLNKMIEKCILLMRRTNPLNHIKYEYGIITTFVDLSPVDGKIKIPIMQL